MDKAWTTPRKTATNSTGESVGGPRQRGVSFVSPKGQFLMSLDTKWTHEASSGGFAGDPYNQWEETQAHSMLTASVSAEDGRRYAQSWHCRGDRVQSRS